MSDDKNSPDSKSLTSRRAALAKLGLTAAAVYAAPTVLHLEREAHAIILPTPCGPPKGGKTPSC